jgi:hypothetical protein
MEDFRENSLREHVHLAVDARQQRLVSRIFASFAETIPGGRAGSRAPILNLSWCGKSCVKEVNKKVQVSVSCSFVQGAFAKELPQNETATEYFHGLI